MKSGTNRPFDRFTFIWKLTADSFCMILARLLLCAHTKFGRVKNCSFSREYIWDRVYWDDSGVDWKRAIRYL